MTTKEKALRVIESLPENASLEEIVDRLEQMEHAPDEREALPNPNGSGTGAWELLQQSAGSVQMPGDWAAEHDHYLYGTPKRSSNP